jgi:MSHA biogenesis protein MshO
MSRASHDRVALRQRGFTLVEAVVVIVITGIIGAMVALFIRLPVQGYVDTTARAQLLDLADTTLQRMKRDIRLAVPNSVRVDTVDDVIYLEFLQSKVGGRYLGEEDAVAAGDVLSWSDATDTSFTVVGAMPTGKQSIVKNDYLVVYNLGSGQEPGNAYDCSRACNRALIDAVSGNTVTLKVNPFAGQVAAYGVALMSPGISFQVFPSAVTYACDPSQQTLTRYWNYDIQAKQPSSLAALSAADPNKSGARVALLADGVVAACAFNYDGLLGNHSALVTLELTLADGNSGKLTLVQQVHVDNTP